MFGDEKRPVAIPSSAKATMMNGMAVSGPKVPNMQNAAKITQNERAISPQDPYLSESVPATRPVMMSVMAGTARSSPVVDGGSPWTCSKKYGKRNFAPLMESVMTNAMMFPARNARFLKTFRSMSGLVQERSRTIKRAQKSSERAKLPSIAGDSHVRESPRLSGKRSVMRARKISSAPAMSKDAGSP